MENTNSDPYPIRAECKSDKDKYAKWNVYCDANENGNFDDGELFETILLYKSKCAKAKVAATMNCGSAETTEATVTTTTAPTCDCIVADKYLAKMGPNVVQTCDSVHGTEKKTKYKMTFSCPDFNVVVSTKALPCNKMKKLPKKNAMACVDQTTDNCPCLSQMQKLVKKIGGSAAAVCTKYHKKKPSWKVFCDIDNDNEVDANEYSELQKGKCNAFDFDKDNFQC